jgi:hypothetical protein
MESLLDVRLRAVALFLLSQLMGHLDTRSVEKYAKLDSSTIRAGLDRLSKRGRDDE